MARVGAFREKYLLLLSSCLISVEGPIQWPPLFLFLRLQKLSVWPSLKMQQLVQDSSTVQVHHPYRPNGTWFWHKPSDFSPGLACHDNKWIMPCSTSQESQGWHPCEDISSAISIVRMISVGNTVEMPTSRPSATGKKTKHISWSNRLLMSYLSLQSSLSLSLSFLLPFGLWMFYQHPRVQTLPHIHFIFRLTHWHWVLWITELSAALSQCQCRCPWS